MTTMLMFVRFTHFASTMLLFGASTCLWALASTELANQLIGPVGRIASATILFVGGTALLWLGLEAGLMGGGWHAAVNPDTLVGVLTDTAFGRVWQWRLCLIIVLIAVATLSRQWRSAFGVPASALLLASLGLVGHANIQSGLTGALHRTNAVIHIFAVGGWLGGLVPLILCLRLYGDPRLRKEIVDTLRRFSAWGHCIVALIVVSGVFNTALMLGTRPIDLSSSYQLLLAAKVAIVALMIAIAIFNRYFLIPRLTIDTKAMALLANNTVREIILGSVALALVSIIGVLEPV